MEVIKYEEPTSWDDKGMNWNVPDPRNADYIMAIRQAIMERCAAAHISLPRDVAKISPWKTVSIRQVKAVVQAISSVAGSYFNKDFDEYKDDYSDFPKMWTYRDLILEEGCRLYEFAKTGDLCEMGGTWLKWIKNALDKLTVIRCPGAWGLSYTRSGSKHDPPFDESIGTAMSDAMDDEKGFRTSKFTSVPSSVYAWSGNTHWKCPIPDYEGDPEYNKDGYCGYAQSQSYTFTKIRSWLAEREVDFLAYALVTEPTGPVPYSQELATTIFDAGESRFKKGMNVKKEHVDDPQEMEFDFGNVDSIPKNEVVPTSDFDDKGSATHRRSAKRGYVGKCWFFQDYGCENGFNFRSKEE